MISRDLPISPESQLKLLVFTWVLGIRIQALMFVRLHFADEVISLAFLKGVATVCVLSLTLWGKGQVK